MSRSTFWIERAKRAAARRHQRYGLGAPPPLGRLLEHPPARLGLWWTLRLIAYVVIGSPRQLLRLFWWHLTDRDTPRRRRRIAALAEELRAELGAGARVLVDYFERRLYSRDVARVPQVLERTLHRTTPLVVAQPRSEADVLALFAFAERRLLPVYPRGVSSSPFGGAVPTTNGIVVDLSAMARVREIDADRRLVRVEPGVRWADLLTALAAHRLVPATTPTSCFSTVGGWASTGGLGLNGFGHGHFSAAIAAARVVVPNGTPLALEGDDPLLRSFVGTEGRLGILTELTLRVRQQPRYRRSRLAHFDSIADALAFVDQLVADGHRPAHVALYDRVRLAEENVLFAARHGAGGGPARIVEERDAVFLHFDDEAADERFRSSALGERARGAAQAASYLWAERFFPLKAQRLGPSLLASEVVLPRAQLGRFIARGRRLARRFGSALAVEVLISRTAEEGEQCVTIASFSCDARRRLDYLLRLLLVQLLTRLGVALGGCPYGFGIWNSPFVNRRFPRPVRRELVRQKHRFDPHLLLNPMKSFRIRTRLSVPGVFFLGPVYHSALAFARLFSPILGLVARATSAPPQHSWQVPSPEQQEGRPLLAETALRCTFCGACVSVCPAYLMTGDELVTGRAKLRMAEALLAGEALTEREATSPFQCLQCGLCEEVCQTALPLRDCYEVLERQVARRFSWPADLVASFAERVDAERERYARCYGLALPRWAPADVKPLLGTMQAPPMPREER